MNRAAVEQVLEFIKTHPFSNFQSIKKAGIVKNHHSLKKLLDSFEEQKKIKHIKFWKRYYTEPLSENIVIFSRIAEQADKTFLQLKNPNIKQGSFYREFKIAYEKCYSHGGVRTTNAKRLRRHLAGRIKDISHQNERCLLKAFLCLEIRMIICELEFRKLQQTPLVTIDDQKMIDSIFDPLIFSEGFFRDYDPDSNYIMGKSYHDVEELLDKNYFEDTLYYEWLNSNKDLFYIKISCYLNYLLKDNKKDVAEFFHATKKQRDGFEEHLKKKLDKKREQQIEKSLVSLRKKLNSRMSNKLNKTNNKKTKKSIEKKYGILFAKEKEIIKKYCKAKYQKKYEKEISRTVPKNTKSITHVIKSFHDNKGKLDLNLLLLEQRIENNRLLCYNVKTSVLNVFLYLYITRSLINQIQKHDPDYKRLARKIKKTIPEFVIS